MREHTGPSDGTHNMLIRAAYALTRAGATAGMTP
jgi:hypothetical protein